MVKSNLSIVTIYGTNQSECGYCGGQDTSYSYGIGATALTCRDYQSLIDRGWRRSGRYLYKPDMGKTCCPQYTIRLDAKAFHLRKSHRKVLSKFNRYAKGTWHPNMKTDHQPKPTKNTKTLIEMIHESEVQDHSESNEAKEGHPLQIVLERSSFTKEKYELYFKYQTRVHHDKPDEVTPEGFESFLVTTPLLPEAFKDNKPGLGYGSFHQKYIMDGKLIAVAVLDILPFCVSSVYFMYDPEYSFLGLGTYSALREISLTQELSSSVSHELRWYYMGFYIHSCPKMVYKGQYEPSYLLDPLTYTWFPIEGCKKLLDKRKCVIFSDPEREYKDEEVMLGCLDPKSIQLEDIGKILFIVDDELTIPMSQLIPVGNMADDLKQDLAEFVAALGHELVSRIALK